MYPELRSSCVKRAKKSPIFLGKYGSSAAEPDRHEAHELLATVYRLRKCTIGCTGHHFWMCECCAWVELRTYVVFDV
jgi:hypothetical protein